MSDPDRWLARYYPTWRAGRSPGWYLVDAQFKLEPRGPYPTQEAALEDRRNG